MFKIKIIVFAVLILVLIILPGCNQSKSRLKEFKESELATDSSGLFVSYKNTVFCIPTPQIFNLYLKKQGIYPDRTLVNPVNAIEKYTTTARKAINMGIYGVDLGYMNLFSVSESTNDYIAALSRLSKELGLGIVFTREVFDQINKLKSDQDSLSRYLSTLFAQADRYLKDNSQQLTGSMVIAGGWVESFYLLCKTYKQSKNESIKSLIFQQKFVLENIIKSLAPYYKLSDEMQTFIDELVELAYDFDLLDFKYDYGVPLYKYRKGIMIIDNKVEVSNTRESLDIILDKAEELREKLII